LPWASTRLSLPTIGTGTRDLARPTETLAESERKNEQLKKESITKEPPGHAHSKLQLLCIKSTSKPQYSIDKQFKTFEALLKVASKKLPASSALTANELVALEEIVADLSSSTMPTTPKPQHFQFFDRIVIEWPHKTLFPVLGLFRLFVISRGEVCEYYENKDNSFLARILSTVPKPENKEDNKEGAPVPAQIMALCTISNLFSRPSFANRLARDSSVIQTALAAIRSPDKALRIVSAILLYNASLFLPKDDSDVVVESVSLLVEAIQNEKDPDTCIQLFMALGHLIYSNSATAMIVAALEFDPISFVSSAPFTDSKNNLSKLKQVANDVALILQSKS